MAVDRAIRRSVQAARSESPRVMAYVLAHAREMSPKVVKQHIDLYVNNFSFHLGPRGEPLVDRLGFLLGALSGMVTGLLLGFSQRVDDAAHPLRPLISSGYPSSSWGSSCSPVSVSYSPGAWKSWTRDSWPSPAARAKAIQNSKRILHVIDEVTEIGDIEYRSYQAKMQKVDLTGFLKSKRGEFKQALKLRDVAVSVDVPPHEVAVLVHREHFDLLCRNLLGMATRSGDEGGTLIISLEAKEGNDEERVFLTFRFRHRQPRSEAPARFSTEGPGDEGRPDSGDLRMAFPKKLVDLHRGRLRVEGAGEERVLRLDLPLARKLVKGYEDLRGRVQTGDLVLFKGLYLYGHLATSDEGWTHVGMVVRLPGVAEPLLWESTVEGELPDQELKRKKSGPQLVFLRERLRTYETNLYAVRSLKVARNIEMVKRLYEFIYEVHQLPFPTELQIIRRVIKARLLRRILAQRGRFKDVFSTELIAESYIKMGLLPPYPPSSSYLPLDFSSKKQLPLLRGVYLGPEIHIDLPEKAYVPPDPSLLAQAGHGRI